MYSYPNRTLEVKLYSLLVRIWNMIGCYENTWNQPYLTHKPTTYLLYGCVKKVTIIVKWGEKKRRENECHLVDRPTTSKLCPKVFFLIQNLWKTSFSLHPLCSFLSVKAVLNFFNGEDTVGWNIYSNLINQYHSLENVKKVILARMLEHSEGCTDILQPCIQLPKEHYSFEKGQVLTVTK